MREHLGDIHLPESLLYMMVASLPPIERIDGGSALLTELSMQQRLKLLNVEDRRLLNGISDLLLSIHRQVTIDVPRLQSWWEDLQRRRDLRQLRAYVDYYLQLKTALAAWRCRRQGRDKDDSWAFHPIAARIKRQWTHPDFGLQGALPDFIELRDLAKQSPWALYDGLYRHLWQCAHRLEQQHYFDLDVAALYVVRWRLATNYRSAEAKAAQSRMDTAVDKMLAQDSTRELLSQAFETL